jgi:hypothetical protein
VEGEVPADAQSPTDDGPLIAELVVQLEQLFFLPHRPFLAVEPGIQVVVVSEVVKWLPFATLLARAPFEAEVRVQLLGDEAPLVDPRALVELLEGPVLLLAPWTLPAALPALPAHPQHNDYRPN